MQGAVFKMSGKHFPELAVGQLAFRFKRGFAH
jgi:hypothetical protein